MEVIIAHVTEFLSSYGYWVLLPLLIIEGPITTLVAATLASTGVFNVYVVLLLAIIGDYIGDIALYGFGKRYGQSFLSKRKAKMYSDLEQLFDKQGGKVVFFAKSTTGVVIPTFISAGAFNFSFKKFTLYSLLGGALWSSALVVIGYFFGYIWRTLYEYTTWIGWIMSILLIAIIAGVLYMKRNNVQSIQKLQDEANKPLTSPDPRNQNYIEKPFLLPGSNGCGVLLIHGWSATPYETQHLARTLNEEGYTTYSVMLSGHGKTPAHLKNVTMEDWIRDVEQGFDFLQKNGATSVSVVGNSLGGNLALILAHKYPEIKKIVLTGTPHTIRRETFGILLLPILSFFRLYKKKEYPKNMYMPPEVLKHFIVHPVYPIKSSIEALRTMRLSKKLLKNIFQPTLIIQSAEDHLVVSNNAERFRRELGSAHAEVLIVPRLYHNFIFDQSNTKIFTRIREYLAS